MAKNRLGLGSISTFCYWVGIAMAIACVGMIAAGNTNVLWRLEHTRLPLSWVMGIAAVLAFLAAELSDSGSRMEEAESAAELVRQEA